MDARTAQLVAALRRRRVAGAADLAADLGVSQPTLSRLLRAIDGDVVRFGRARRTRYALVRRVRGLPAELPVYRVTADGRPQQCTTLSALYPDGTFLRDAPVLGWPLDETMREGIFPSLPYFIFDMRPQGFLGRAFAREHGVALDLPFDPNRWSDDDVLIALAHGGADLPGDLIVGTRAVEAFQLRRAEGAGTLSADARADVYPELAASALLGEPPGSSAGGEFAKFTAAVDDDGALRHVLVKFSPADRSPAADRWRDLLVAEHHASAALAGMGVRGAASSILDSRGRIFLEVSRFDRIGAHGRRAAVTLAALDAALLGTADQRWPTAAEALQRRHWLTTEDVQRVARLWWFGQFIGNTDMHGGNLAFLQAAAERLALAPAYDMMPTLFAPSRTGEIVSRRLAPPPPAPGAEAAWREALAAAIGYWSRLAGEARLSGSFRELSAANRAQLDRLGERLG